MYLQCLVKLGKMEKVHPIRWIRWSFAKKPFIQDPGHNCKHAAGGNLQLRSYAVNHERMVKIGWIGVKCGESCQPTKQTKEKQLQLDGGFRCFQPWHRYVDASSFDASVPWYGQRGPYSERPRSDRSDHPSQGHVCARRSPAAAWPRCQTPWRTQWTPSPLFKRYLNFIGTAIPSLTNPYNCHSKSSSGPDCEWFQL
jgi:hypothetical protein